MQDIVSGFANEASIHKSIEIVKQKLSADMYNKFIRDTPKLSPELLMFGAILGAFLQYERL